MAIDIDAIQHAILEQRANWVARPHSPFVDLTEDQLRRRLGVILDEKRLEELRRAPSPEVVKVIAHFETSPIIPFEQAHLPRERVSQVADRLRLAEQAVTHLTDRTAATSLTASLLLRVDWRYRKGRNNVTPVKDQGGCGSCVAFGVTGTLESMVLVEHNLALDLSEAELLFCGGGSCGGWWPDSAVTYIKNHGEAFESCFPYHDHDMPCSTCPDRNGEATQVVNKTGSFASLTDNAILMLPTHFGAFTEPVGLAHSFH
jgi:hypothetical protein